MDGAWGGEGVMTKRLYGCETVMDPTPKGIKSDKDFIERLKEGMGGNKII